MFGRVFNRHKANSLDCGSVFVQEDKIRTARYTDNDPWYKTELTEHTCTREYGHGGDHIAKEPYQQTVWVDKKDVDPRKKI